MLEEGRCIQCHLTSRKPPSDAGKSGQELSDTLFSNMVFSGKISAASHYLSQDSCRGVLNHDDVDPVTGRSVLESLRSKHPSTRPAPEGSLLNGPSREPNQIIYESINAKCIRLVALRINGSAGPSGLDAEAWKRMLSAFHKSSERLCTALASAAKCLCTEDIRGEYLMAFVASRLIPLDKAPDVRPIAVGEVFRRIVGKAVTQVLERDIMYATAPAQLCVRIPSACEVAIHAMNSIYQQDQTEAVLLVDAKNAFNAVNREAALHNIPILCPPLGRMFRNTYSTPIRLFLRGGEEALSTEGTCQGDPLAMAYYALAIIPLLTALAESCPSIAQAWYADDDSAAGSVSAVRDYWTEVSSVGPAFGYYPTASKTLLLVKSEHKQAAEAFFADTGIAVKTGAVRYLGGLIGDPECFPAQLRKRIESFLRMLEECSKMAHTQPHAAYTVLVVGLQNKWTFLQRVVPSAEEYRVLEEAVCTQLMPSLMGRAFSPGEAERVLLAVPTRFGGLNIRQPGAHDEFEASVAITQPIVDLLVGAASAVRADMGVLRSGEFRTLSVPGYSLQTGGFRISSVPGSSLAQPPPESSRTLQSDEFQTSSVPGSSLAQPPPESSCISHGDLGSVMAESRSRARSRKQQKIDDVNSSLANLEADLKPTLQRLLQIAAEKGVSSWLTEIPSSERGTVLRKSDFRDALAIRYGYDLDGLPAGCVCGAALTMDHAFTCPCGGYPMARHDTLRDLLANVLTEVLPDVETEPVLLPHEGEDLPGCTANRSREARLDIRAQGFWSRQQDAFFDVRVTHPKASLLSRSEVLRQLSRHESQKKREYGACIINVDRGSFTPLVFSTNGLCARESSMFLKSLASLIVSKHDDIPFSVVMNRLRTRISFCLLRWCITCFRGCRSSYTSRRLAGGFANECRRFSL